MESVKKKGLVKVSFSIDDIQDYLRDKYQSVWTTQQCKDFLLQHECLISDRMCEAGWDAIEKEIKQCNDLELGFVKPDQRTVLGVKTTEEARWFLDEPHKTDDELQITDADGKPLTCRPGEYLGDLLNEIKSELIPPTKDHKPGIYQKTEVYFLV